MIWPIVPTGAYFKNMVRQAVGLAEKQKEGKAYGKIGCQRRIPRC
jgi:hypothetical protein